MQNTKTTIWNKHSVTQLVARDIFRRIIAIAIHPLNIFDMSRIGVTVALLITQENSANSKVRGRY